MDNELLLRNFLLRAARFYPKKEIVSVYPNEVFRYCYADYFKRTCQLAHALKALGVKRGDRVASFALNNHRHLELYFGVPCYGAVLHTVNIRLPQEHLIYIINHAEDQVLFIDEDLLFLIEPIRDKLTTVKHFVVLSQSGTMPPTSLYPVSLYDDLIWEHPESYDFPEDIGERDPAVICYTSATTGQPKGVVYSHRGIVMHTYGIVATLGVSESDTALHIVPMFHVNGWGAPFGALAMGCKQVLPGRDILNMQKLCHIIAEEKITFTGGVPTIWMMLYDYLEKGGLHDFSSLKTIFSGGAACPLALMKGLNEKYGFPIRQAYGMTETSPMALVSLTKSYMADWPMDKIYDIRGSAGMPALGVEMKIVNDQGKEVRMDGKEWGEIRLRGPWITKEYFKDPENSGTTYINGWLHTGDIGTIDEEGYVRLVDRKKDLIKSGGEWISSVDIENTLMTCPKIMEAAVIGIPDVKWQERPMACIALAPGETMSCSEIKDFLKGKITSWWIPEYYITMDQIPKTSAGKFNKRELRQLFAEGKICTVSDFDN